MIVCLTETQGKARPACRGKVKAQKAPDEILGRHVLQRRQNSNAPSHSGIEVHGNLDRLYRLVPSGMRHGV